MSLELTAPARLPSQLYRSQWSFVCRALARFGVPPSAVEDAAQDVFCIAHRRWGDYADRGELRAWLTAISRRVAFRHRRGAERRGARQEQIGEWQSRIVDPEDAAVRNEALGALNSFLGSLDEDKRTVFVLSEIVGERPVDIAQQCALNVHTVNTRLRRARAEFAATFAPEEPRRSSRAIVVLLPWWRRPIAAVAGWFQRLPAIAIASTMGAAAVTVTVVAHGDAPAVLPYAAAPETEQRETPREHVIATLPAPVAPTPVALPQAPPEAPAPTPMRSRPRRDRAPTSIVAAPVAAAPVVTPTPASTLAAELRSLDRIRRTANVDPAKALREIAEHRAAYPQSTFRPELDALESRATSK